MMEGKGNRIMFRYTHSLSLFLSLLFSISTAAHYLAEVILPAGRAAGRGAGQSWGRSLLLRQSYGLRPTSTLDGFPPPPVVVLGYVA
jgi:hypothetical protein